MNPSQIQQIYAESNHALVDGGFSAFYQAQLACFLRYCPDFNYQDFSQETGRAVRPIQSMKTLLAYNACYSADHFARFQYLLSHVQNLSSEVITDPIRLCVFDYGCGQGLATLALLGHLKGRQVELIIHLIEPSALALASAQQYVQAFAGSMHGQVTVHAYQCGLDQIPDHVFSLPEGYSAVHLFSNVLDLAHRRLFDLSCLATQLNRIVGKHICFAVSPTFYSGKLGFDQLKYFFKPSRMLVDQEICNIPVVGYRCDKRMLVPHNANGRFLAFVRCVSHIDRLKVA